LPLRFSTHQCGLRYVDASGCGKVDEHGTGNRVRQRRRVDPRLALDVLVRE
jgi:hypothetical protein